MTHRAQWERLPLELRVRPQWLLAGPNERGELKVPMTVRADGRLHPGSNTDPAQWLDFDYAVSCAEEHGYGIGYVLSADDPYACVDLDVKDQQSHPNEPDKWTTLEQFQMYQRMAQVLSSYTEFSRSGKGVHIWCKANIGPGVKRDGVEVYSQERFIACTGNVLYDLPLVNQQAVLDNMVGQMRAAQQQRQAQLNEAGAEEPDDVIWQRARTADNSEKFLALCEGKWVELGYPSQSEADTALMSMFTFYSRSNEQCRRMFRMTKLGEREKAQKDDRYLDLTLKLIRGRQEREALMLEKQRGVVANLLRNLEQQATQALTAGVGPGHPLPPPPQPVPGPLPPVGAPPATPPVPPAPPQAVPAGELPWPPGLAGAIAQFVYSSANRPVREVAIVAALGWLAGVCGKAWHIPGSGLNLYIILVARSAVGKEAMHGGLSALQNRIREGVPTADKFVDFSDFASGPALAKACAANSSFVNVAGEWGRKLKRLARENDRDGPMQQLRTIMTNLYQKSGPNSIVGGVTYSDKEKNIASISGVAYSMIGETTPGTLYDSLTEDMMEDGFLSRFTIIAYDGPRPAQNLNPVIAPSNELAHYCQEMVVHATTMLQNHARKLVARSDAAGVVMDAFDKECDANINSTDDEAQRQMWNRAHLKMCRIAALLAVGDNYHEPVIQLHHVEWALDVVRRDIAIMARRLESGDVGTSDNSREKKLVSIIKDYLTNKHLGESYGVDPAMQRDHMIPRKYLQLRTCRVSSFMQHPQGTVRALNEALQNLCDSGYLVEIDKTKVGEQYGFQGRCYRVVNLPR